MNVEKIKDGIRYTLSNDNLQNGDEVFPIANGRCLGGNDWILHGFDFRDFMSGFPDEPHIILNTKASDYKPYEVKTDHGSGPIESYYKITKKEQHVKSIDKFSFKTAEWIEIPLAQTIK